MDKKFVEIKLNYRQRLQVLGIGDFFPGHKYIVDSETAKKLLQNGLFEIVEKSEPITKRGKRK